MHVRNAHKEQYKAMEDDDTKTVENASEAHEIPDLDETSNKTMDTSEAIDSSTAQVEQDPMVPSTPNEAKKRGQVSKLNEYLDNSTCLLCKKTYKNRKTAMDHLRRTHDIYSSDLKEKVSGDDDQVQDQLHESLILDEASNDQTQDNLEHLEQGNNADDLEHMEQGENSDELMEQDSTDPVQDPEPRHICYPCNKGFEMDFELKIHQKKCNMRSCKYCKVGVIQDEHLGHEDKCAEASKYIGQDSCIICDLQFSDVGTVFKHVVEEHLNNDSSRTSSHSDIQITKVESNYPVAKREEYLLEESSTPMFMPFGGTGQDDQEDPRIVHKLYKCPICLKCLLFLQHAQDHITRFHHIPVQHQVRMGLNIEEMIIPETF